MLISNLPFIRGTLELSSNKKDTFYDKRTLDVMTSKWSVIQNGKSKQYNVTIFNGKKPTTDSIENQTTFVQIDDLSEEKERNFDIYQGSEIIASISPFNFMFFGNYDISKDYVLKSPLFITSLNTFVSNAVRTPTKLPKERYTILDPSLQTKTSRCCKTCIAISILVSFIASGFLVYFSKYKA